MKTKTLNDHLSLQASVPAEAGPMLEPLFTWRGMNVYPVFGGAEGDGDDDDDPDGEQDDDDNGGTGESGKGKEGDKPVTREDLLRIQSQLKAADKGRAAAEKKLKEIEDSKKDELTKATDEVAELTKAREEDGRVIAELRLHNAFLTADTGITWQDPADALALAEKRGYLREVVDEDGNVDDKLLAAKLKELATAKPHLVKSESAGDGGKEKKEDKGPGSTGSRVGSGKGKGSKDEPNLDRYSRLFR